MVMCLFNGITLVLFEYNQPDSIFWMKAIWTNDIYVTIQVRYRMKCYDATVVVWGALDGI